MAPRGLGIRRETATGRQEKRDILRPRDRLRASWITEVFHLLDPWPAAERPGCSCPVPCGTAPAF